MEFGARVGERPRDVRVRHGWSLPLAIIEDRDPGELVEALQDAGIVRAAR